MPKSRTKETPTGSSSPHIVRLPDRWDEDDDLNEAIHAMIAEHPWIVNCLAFLTQISEQDVLSLQRMAIILLGDHRTLDPPDDTLPPTQRRRKRTRPAEARCSS